VLPAPWDPTILWSPWDVQPSQARDPDCVALTSAAAVAAGDDDGDCDEAAAYYPPPSRLLYPTFVSQFSSPVSPKMTSPTPSTIPTTNSHRRTSHGYHYPSQTPRIVATHATGLPPPPVSFDTSQP
jgi:hypothetical protein